jgi:hypothetical protein
MNKEKVHLWLKGQPFEPRKEERLLAVLHIAFLQSLIRDLKSASISIGHSKESSLGLTTVDDLFVGAGARELADAVVGLSSEARLFFLKPREDFAVDVQLAVSLAVCLAPHVLVPNQTHALSLFRDPLDNLFAVSFEYG